MTVINYATRDGSYATTFDIATLSPANLTALVSRAVNHILGNEAASKLIAWRKANPTLAGTDAEVAQFKTIRDEMSERIRTGELGVRQSGPKVDPLEAEMDKLALSEVLAKLANDYQIKIAKKDADDELVIKLANGETTLGELTDRWLAKNAERIEKEAKDAIRVRDREAMKRAAEAAKKAEALKALDF